MINGVSLARRARDEFECLGLHPNTARRDWMLSDRTQFVLGLF